MPTEMARTAMSEVLELLEAAEAKAMYGLAINWKPLQALTEALLDRGVLQVGLTFVVSLFLRSCCSVVEGFAVYIYAICCCARDASLWQSAYTVHLLNWGIIRPSLTGCTDWTGGLLQEGLLVCRVTQRSWFSVAVTVS